MGDMARTGVSLPERQLSQDTMASSGVGSTSRSMKMRSNFCLSKARNRTTSDEKCTHSAPACMKAARTTFRTDVLVTRHAIFIRIFN